MDYCIIIWCGGYQGICEVYTNLNILVPHLGHVPVIAYLFFRLVWTFFAPLIVCLALHLTQYPITLPGEFFTDLFLGIFRLVRRRGILLYIIVLYYLVLRIKYTSCLFGKGLIQ
jgi:hypothetical protein